MVAKISRDDQGAADLDKWRMLALLGVGVVFSMTPWFSTAAIIPELTDMWDLSDRIIALLTNSVQAGFVIGALVASFLNLPDIFSPVRLMSVGALAAGISTLGIIIAGGPEVVIVLRFVTGISLAFVYPPMMKLTTTWFLKGRGLSLGIIIGALTLGSAMPHLLRASMPNVDWEIVVAAAAILSIIGAVIFEIFISEGPFPYKAAKFDLQQIGKVFTDRAIALANIGYFGHMWELYAMWAWFLVFVQSTNFGSDFGSISPEVASFIVFAVI